MIKIHVTHPWTRIYVSPFARTVQSVNVNLPYFSFLWVKNWENFAWFHMKSLQLSELGVNRISQFRIEVKFDSVKGSTLLLKVNFPLSWIHWPITNLYIYVRIQIAINEKNLWNLLGFRKCFKAFLNLDPKCKFETTNPIFRNCKSRVFFPRFSESIM